MSSVAGQTRKLSEEIIETLTDKIASLRAAGQMDEALEEEKKLARVQRQFKGEEANASLDDTLTPNDKAAASFTADGMERPAVDATDWGKPIKTGAPDTFSAKVDVPTLDATDWSNPLSPSPKEAKGVLAADLSGIPGVRTGQQGQALVRKPIPGTALAGVGAAGLAASTSLGTDDVNKPITPPTPPAEEKPVEPAKVDGGGGGSKDPYAFTPVAPEEARNFLTGLAASMPTAPDMTDWQTKYSGIKDARQEKANELKANILEAKAASEVAGASIERRELIETITNAIGSVVAGMYGMKHGLDLSGAKFNKTDWNAKLDMLNKQLQQNIAVLKDQHGIDQAIIDEKKDALMQDKETLLRGYENDWKRWQGKGQIAGMQQAQENRRVDKKFEADKFNTEMGIKMEEAAKKAEKERAEPRGQISAGVKAAIQEKDSLTKQYYDLLQKANSNGSGGNRVTDDGRRAMLAEMEGIDRRIAEITGVPLMPSQEDPSMPMSYAKVDADDLAEAAAGRFAKQDEILGKVKRMREEDYRVLAEPEAMMSNLAVAALESNPRLGPIGAMKYAQQEYRKTVRDIFSDLKKWETANGMGAPKK